MTAIRLVVGLGNPGAEYEKTRHNAGFWLVDELAWQHKAPLRAEGKYSGDVSRAVLPGGDLWLLKPMTYMNLSGQAVGALARFYKIAPEEILVVHDELDLPPGAARFKQGGGHAPGHVRAGAVVDRDPVRTGQDRGQRRGGGCFSVGGADQCAAGGETAAELVDCVGVQS